MLTPQAIQNCVRKFQEQELESNVDHSVLQQQKSQLEGKLLRERYLTKRLQLLYSQIDKTRNYQEFVDLLMNSRSLLREIFTVEGLGRRARHADPEVDWSKFGVDIADYVARNDELLALYNDGLL
ncbi:hypothetical protein HG536_0A09320 [Torulaspora globosa]|uniref:Uncharacterized protein n=1 Tax=Torulaspora globosa TaxID=48254 RepID=A0A7G3ZC79_9SACH|nr:uncharacterized protein HG536_0A09320 [Torulaspora globosa]QLL31115.1 hypothetical protein HG536_0A09320 [Torulaspora globosa]